MSTTASRGAGALSRFAHFAGIVAKPNGDNSPATVDDVDNVDSNVQDVQDEVDEVKDDVTDLEDRVDSLEQDEEQEDNAAPTAEHPAERAAYLKGRAAGRKAEQARAGAILAAPAAAKNRNLALHLAFEGSLPAKQAVALLKASAEGMPSVPAAPAAATPPANGNSLDARMNGSKPVNLGAGGASGPDMTTAEGVAAHVMSVAKRAGIVK